MRITIEIDDEEVRRVLAPLVQQAPAAQMQPPSRLLKVNEVADRLGVSRNKVYELLYRGDIQSLAIGRTRRISPVALAEFIARPKDVGLHADPEPRQVLARLANTLKTTVPSPKPAPPKTRWRKSAETIDLSPKPLPSEPTHARMSEEELEGALASMLEKGWPEDVVEQIRTDRKEGVHRVNALTINDAARYLGLSRSGVEKLIKVGKLRLFTIAPTYRDDKPAKRIPANDVAGLR
ncbi:MAG TPA: helix-turn-helix domain-containing protein [Candidatus Eisenbacteria bacterium]|nr:helix-turn-helix domain-containing protein [Candidatus Eisenbacteria bacterium]